VSKPKRGAGARPRAESATTAPLQVRLSPAERAAAEAVLRDGETLSQLVREGLAIAVDNRTRGGEGDLAELGRAVLQVARDRGLL
jgi:hypothetical protein